MKTPYTYLEAEEIEKQYDEQIPYDLIAENINNEFHNGKQVRNKNSIKYVIRQIYGDDDWYDNLEEKWLSKTK